jgi:hypothetical protein
MDEAVRIEGTVTKVKPRQLPKKYLRSARIRIAKGYTCMATIWVPNTPYSKYAPKVVLSLTHNKRKLCFCFDNAADMVIAVEELRRFVGEVAVKVNDALNEALWEFFSHHRSEMLPSFNEYTITVVQERSKNDQEEVTCRVNAKTGEITEETYHEPEKPP